MAAMLLPLLHLHMMNGGSTLALQVLYLSVWHDLLRDMLTMLFRQSMPILATLFPASLPELVLCQWFMSRQAITPVLTILWVPVRP